MIWVRPCKVHTSIVDVSPGTVRVDYSFPVTPVEPPTRPAAKRSFRDCFVCGEYCYPPQVGETEVRVNGRLVCETCRRTGRQLPLK